jgi:site-specific recombinase XerC
MNSLPLTIGYNSDTIGMEPPVSLNPNSLTPYSPVPLSVVDLTNNKVNQIKQSLEWDPAVQEIVSNKAAEKVIVNDVEFKFLVSKIDFYKELETFLANRNSPATRTGYKHSIMEFVKWCNNQDLNPLEVTVHDVDRYQCSLDDNQFSNKTIRTRILGVSSFYTFLSIRYPRVLKVNPFTRRNLPKDRCLNPKDYIKDSDIKALKKEFKRIGRNDIITVLDLLSKYGFRVGSFETLSIDKDGGFSCTSKGSDYVEKFTKKECQQITRFNVLDLTTSTIKTTIKKYVHKLYLVGGVSCDFSVHDIRRYYINKHADGCKDFREFLEFSRTIHKNVWW